MTQRGKYSASKGILYEHEMAHAKSQEGKIAKWVIGGFGVMILSICLLPLLAEAISSEMPFIIKAIVLLSPIPPIYLLTVHEPNKIKAVLTDEMLLLRGPEGHGWGTFSAKLKIPYREITCITIHNLRSLKLKKMMNEDGHLTIRHSAFSYFRTYQYIFAINVAPLPYGTQFVEIELKNGKPILFEFNDGEKFADVFKRKISLPSISVVIEGA